MLEFPHLKIDQDAVTAEWSLLRNYSFPREVQKNWKLANEQIHFGSFYKIIAMRLVRLVPKIYLNSH